MISVDKMRWVDYWVGIPLCFFCSLLLKIQRLFTKSQMVYQRDHQGDLKIKRVLFIQLSEMGSTILAYPLFHCVKETYADAELFFLIFDKNRVCIDVMNVIPKKNVLTIRTTKLFSFLSDLIKCIYQFRRLQIDIVFDLELFSRCTALISFLTGAPKRVGFYQFHAEGLYRGNLLTHKISYNFQRHISVNFLSFLERLDQPTKDTPEIVIPAKAGISLPVIQRSEAQKEVMRKKLGFCHSEPPRWGSRAGSGRRISIILMNPDGGILPIRAWPLEHYVTLAKFLVKDEQTMIVLIGDETAKPVNDELLSALGPHDRIKDFTNQTTFEELLTLFSISDILVANDGGASHFASLIPTIKSFVFYGPETPKLYSPLGSNTTALYADAPCSPCLTAFNHRKTACQDNQCLKVIKPDDVSRLIQNALN